MEHEWKRLKVVWKGGPRYDGFHVSSSTTTKRYKSAYIILYYIYISFLRIVR
jgi:hypothetical protein